MRRAGAGCGRPRGSTAIGPTASLMPQRPTMLRAISVSCWMSDSAPVVISPKTISSATRPPRATLILDIRNAAVVGDAVALGRREGDAQRHPARDDRHLAHRVGAGGEHADDRVAALVVGGAAAVLLREHHRPRRAEHDLLEGVGEVRHLDPLVLALGRQQRRLVGEVGEVGADHARASSRPGGRGRRRPRAAPSACAPRGCACGRPCRAAGRSRGGRSGPGAAAPGRARPGGSWPRSRSRPRPTRSRPSR